MNRCDPANGDGVPTPCIICEAGTASARDVASEVRYLQCDRCHGTFVARDWLPSQRREREHYELHDNDPEDRHYRQFVSHLVEPLAERLEKGAEGLDYGCGAGPAGAAMLSDSGYAITFYDPFFAPDQSALERDYDFIFCSEVAEHFHNPSGEFEKLDGLLRPGGILAVMTSMEYSDVNFDGWYYRRDPTHVVFYKPDTMMQIAKDRGWQAIIPSRNVVLFRKEN